MLRFTSLPKSPRVAPLRHQQDGSSPPTALAPESPPGSRQLLWNRMLLSILALSLLWGTSLNAAPLILSFFVNLPPATFPIQVCRTAAREIHAQATAYKQCAAHQMLACDRDLDEAVRKESARSKRAHEQNIARLELAESLHR